MRIFNLLLPLLILLTISTITAGQEKCPCDYPSISFKEHAVALTGEQKEILAGVALKMKEHPDCTIVMNGYPGKSKIEETVCQKRIAQVKIYLVEKLGISSDRIFVDCMSEGGDKNRVDIKCN